MSGLRERLQASLGASYRLDRELPGGGMAHVFVAVETGLGRKVVVKILRTDLGAAVSAERFEREIRIAAQLQHPHIVPLHAAGAADDVPYYTMPFVDGESLRDRVARQGALPIGEVVRILRDVLKGVAYAHSVGVVHRDIKPENILLTADSAVITDFGIAKALDASRTEPGSTLTQTGVAIGTPAYMAPEQAAAEPVIDHRADIYAVGCLAYELLAGQPPFAGRSASRTLAAHVSETPVPISSIRAETPPALAAVVMACLEKDPGVRPQSARDILELLEGLGTGGSQAARPGMRRRWIVAATAAISIVVSLAAVASKRLWDGPEEPTMIAVIPFEHHGPEEWAYFADGLADAIGGKLAGLPGLAVIDRRSSAQYKGSPKTVQQIGQELGVEYVLEGVVRWTSDGDTALTARRALVTPTLVRTRDARIQWADEPVAVTLTDPVKAQVDIASSVAAELGIALRPTDSARLARRPTQNPAAYDAFVRGDLVYRSWDGSFGNADELRGGIAALERAVRLDSAFALAWARLALLRGIHAERYSADSREFKYYVEAARREVQRAIALDPALPDAYVAQSFVTYLGGDDLATQRAVARAVELGADDATTLALLGTYLTFAGHDDGYDLILRAARLGPRSMFPQIQAAQMSYRLKRPDDIDRYARAAIALDSLSGPAHRFYSTAPLLRGDTVRAHERLLVADRVLGPESPWILDLLWRAFGEPYRTRLASSFLRVSVSDSLYYYDMLADKYEATGNRPLSLVYRDSIVRLAGSRVLATGPSPQAPLGTVAHAHAALGNRAEALRYLAQADSVLKARTLNIVERCFYLDYGAAVMSMLGNRDSTVTLFSRRLAEPCGRNAAFYRALGPSRDVIVYRMRGYRPFDSLISQ